MNWLTGKFIIRLYIDETAQADPEVMENNRELEEKAGFWAVSIIIFF